MTFLNSILNKSKKYVKLNFKMGYKKPTPTEHPLITNGSLSKLYKNLIQCNKCPRIVDFRTKIAKEKRKQFLNDVKKTALNI